SHIDVLVNEPIGTIAPELYGHFVEHLGGVVYDGVWVGERSRVPNIGGIRQALVEALRPVHPAVVRWPGGCFADPYDWQDAIWRRSRCGAGGSATSPGDAAATSRRRHPPPSTAASPPGRSRRTASTSRSSGPVRAAETWNGRAGASASWPSAAASIACGAGR